jgi:hypothetical protein
MQFTRRQQEDKNMEYFARIERRDGVDVGYNGSAIEPLNRVGCVGKAGIDKNFTLEQVMPLAYEVRANIIVKSGKNAKWYLKRCNPTDIEATIQKQSWRKTKLYTMWIIEW